MACSQALFDNGVSSILEMNLSQNETFNRISGLYPTEPIQLLEVTNRKLKNETNLRISSEDEKERLKTSNATLNEEMEALRASARALRHERDDLNTAVESQRTHVPSRVVHAFLKRFSSQGYASYRWEETCCQCLRWRGNW